MKDVFKKYTEGTPSERKAMLKTYGEKQLKVLVENVLSEQWIQKESKQCPHCKVPIEVRFFLLIFYSSINVFTSCYYS